MAQVNYLLDKTHEGLGNNWFVLYRIAFFVQLPYQN